MPRSSKEASRKKKTDGETLTHAARARLVVRHAKTGAHVVRLISGDPFNYSTGPEEALACAKAGIGFEIVPGIPSVSAVPAYAGVPLTNRTNREYSVVRVGDAKIDWSAHVGADTLVLLSAVARIGEVAEALVEAGRSPETPVAMTAWAPPPSRPRWSRRWPTSPPTRPTRA